MNLSGLKRAFGANWKIIGVFMIVAIFAVGVGLSGVAIAAPGQGNSQANNQDHPLDCPEHPGNQNQQATENVPGHAEADLPFTEEPELIEIPEYGEEQYEFFLETELVDPIEVVVDIDGEEVEETELEVAVTNHHGEFEETPTTTLRGWEDFEFGDGQGSFTIGEAGSGADFELWGWDINDIETLQVEATDDDVDVGALYLTPESVEE